MKLHFDHIEGLDGSVPIGAVVSVGRKSANGQPEKRRSFFILGSNAEEREFRRRDGGTYKALQRPMHPMFGAWNKAAESEDGSCSTLMGHLAYPTAGECWNANLRAQQLGKGTGTPPGGGTWQTPPGGRPACEGDGKRARRFAGVGSDGELKYIDIACPHDLCPFRRETEGKMACKPFGRLYLMIRIEGQPLTLAKLQTQSWASCRNISGLFEYVERFAAEAGIERPNLMGLPIVLSLTTKSRPEKGRTFPVITASAACDLVEFFGRQVERLRLAAGATPLALLPGGNANPAEHGRALDLDFASLVPGPGLPANVIDIPAESVTEDAAVPPPEPLPNGNGDAKELARALRKVVATADDAGDLLAELLAEGGVRGPRRASELTADQLATAWRRFREHPLGGELFS